jgi:DMSO/TMAO reductase YedYZ molybdopterin-dependent catalytic subunit
MPEPEIRMSMPVHRADGANRWPGRLRIDGLVTHPLDLGLSDLAALPQRTLTDDFACLEGWTVPAVRWQGVSLATILERAGVLPAAGWLQASAGDFSVPLPLPDVQAALLATCLEDQRLPPEHGGPVRLVVPGGACYASIKWLDHLELRYEPAPNSGRAIALARLPGAPRTEG